MTHHKEVGGMSCDESKVGPVSSAEARVGQAPSEDTKSPAPLSPSYVLGLGLMLLPSNHLALSPKWQGWFLRWGVTDMVRVTDRFSKVAR